jgi:ankyrin repeat protein
MHAARSAEMVQLLLDHNADPELVNDINRRPLQWYVIRDEIAAMRSILQHGAKVNLNTRYEQPLHEAALHNLPAVQLLVEHGADLEQKDFDMKVCTVGRSELKLGRPMWSSFWWSSGPRA